MLKELSQQNIRGFRRIALLGGPIAAGALMLFVDLVPGKQEVTATAAIALLMAIWWMTEALPLAVTALLPLVAFPLFGVMDGKAVSVQYMNWIIFLFMGGFMVALAMERWGLHQRIALQIMVRVGGRTRAILFGFMGACAFLSMWISNTATAMMMVPIALALVNRMQGIMQGSDRFARGIFLGIAYGSSIGGVATLVGTPPNLIFVRVFSQSFPDAPEITFASWMIFALPFCVMLLLVTWGWLVYLYDPPEKTAVVGGAFREQLRELGPMSSEEKVVAGVSLAMALLWLFRGDLNLGFFTIPGWSGLFKNGSYFNDGTVAMACALALFLIPARSGGAVLDWSTASKLPWHVLLLFGGGFALAKGFLDSGLSQWFADKLHGVSGLPVIAIVLVACLLITFLTELTSNTATSQIFLPVMAALAVSIGAPAPIIMIPVTMACSFAFMLPVATPPNAIVFGSGKIDVADMVRAGLVLNFLAVVGISLYTWLVGPYLL